MVVEGAGPGWGGQERACPTQTRNAFGSSSSAPSPLASPAAALVELSQAATPTEGDLQMAPRIWDFSILTFAASIPLSNSFLGVWHDVSLSPGSPDFFPALLGRRSLPCLRRVLGTTAWLETTVLLLPLRNGFCRPGEDTRGSSPQCWGPIAGSPPDHDLCQGV